MIHQADPISIGIITVFYVLFAVQLGYQAGPDLWRTRGARAILALVVVFVLCAIAGYLSTIIDIGWYRRPLHWLLAGASVWLVVTNQAKAVARMLEITTDD